jgi:Tfp pilus assembly protein PilO
MRSRVAIFGVLLGVVVVLVWNLTIFAPKGHKLSNAKKDTQAAQQIEGQLRAVLKHLQEISHNGPEIAAQLDKLSSAIPVAPDLDGFILSANQIAVQSGIDWLSVSPSLVQAGPTGVSFIPLSIQVKGGFFQALDYLNRLEDMGRLVIVDGINVSAAEAEGTSDTGSSGVATGPPNLSITLTARMFTRATPPPPAGTAPTSGTAGSTTSSSTPPASGNSSGATSTTAQVN